MRAAKMPRYDRCRPDVDVDRPVVVVVRVLVVSVRGGHGHSGFPTRYSSGKR